MNEEKAKKREEILKLMLLKKDILSAQITESQTEINELENKMSFYERLAGEWAATGGFQQSQSSADSIEPLKTELEKTRIQIERIQRDRLKLSVSMRSLSC